MLHKKVKSERLQCMSINTYADISAFTFDLSVAHFVSNLRKLDAALNLFPDLRMKQRSP